MGTLALLLTAALAGAAGRPSAMTPAKYKTLQQNVDRAFMRAYLNKKTAGISPAPSKTSYIGTQIVRATGNTFFFHWQFYRIKNEQANAITSPKGSIFLYTGLDRLKLTDAEWAGLIAHEVAHQARSHWLARVQRNIEARVLAQYAAKTYGPGSAQISALNSMIKGLQYSRDEEYEADALGAQFMLSAGYPPTAMETLLQKIEADWQSRSPGMALAGAASDHPATADRVARLEALIPTLRAQKAHLRPMR